MGQTVIALPELEWESPSLAVADGAGLDSEAIGLLLQRAVLAFAAHTADGAPVSPVSVTMDTTGPLPNGARLRFTTQLDRRTRTLIFAHGSAAHTSPPESSAIMTATAIFRIGQA